jgi:hypothetical protein
MGISIVSYTIRDISDEQKYETSSEETLYDAYFTNVPLITFLLPYIYIYILYQYIYELGLPWPTAQQLP